MFRRHGKYSAKGRRSSHESPPHGHGFAWPCGGERVEVSDQLEAMGYDASISCSSIVRARALHSVEIPLHGHAKP